MRRTAQNHLFNTADVCKPSKVNISPPTYPPLSKGISLLGSRAILNSVLHFSVDYYTTFCLVFQHPPRRDPNGLVPLFFLHGDTADQNIK